MLMLVLGFIIFCNLYVAHTMTAKEMKTDFVIEQGIIGRICANSFYALAWALKGVKSFVK